MSDDSYVIDVCKFFYPGKPPTKLNPKIKDVAARMLWSAIEKSKAIDLVPRPTGTRPDFSWLIKQAVQIFWRTQRTQQIYEAARVAVAVQYKSIYELALLGE